MQEEKLANEKSVPEADFISVRERAIECAQQVWRPAGTLVAVMLILGFGWSVVNGKHGLSVWHQQHTEDKQLRQEIRDLEQENAHLRDHVERLKSDPSAIEHEAREKLHYAKSGEVIYTLPVQPQSQPIGSGK
jgi:cell division protein FtsB